MYRLLCVDGQEANSFVYLTSLAYVFRLGSWQGATFCALSSLYDECTEDSTVDVYQLIRLYVLQRPDVFTKQVIVYYNFY